MTGLELGVALIAGLFGGAGWNAAWELWLRPRRDSKSIALALVAEIDGNVEIGSSLLSTWDVGQEPVPTMLNFSTLVFTSIVSRIGDVDILILRDLVRLYRLFDDLNEYSELSAQIEAPKGWQGIERVQDRRELAQEFREALLDALELSAKVRESLAERAGTALRRT